MTTSRGFGIGELARRSGATVRALQFYDRLGLLIADRDAGGRRRYGDTHLDRLLRIQLLTRAGFSLAEVAEVLEKQEGRPLADAYTEQLKLLELSELRLRHQRVVLGAIVDALHDDPTMRIPASLIAATMSLDDTMLHYPKLDTGVDAGEFTPEQIERIVAFYLGWKAVAVRALIYAENGVDPASASGKRLGQDWTTAIRDATDAQAEHEHEHAAMESMHDQRDYWPAADRELHDTTKRYLHRCEQALDHQE